MKDRQQRERWILVGFILASGLILFFNLGARSLENHGYIRHAEVAREMIRSGEWGVPHLNGEIYVDKPPLFFWLIAIPASLYGAVTPWIARLPVAVSAWIGVIILFLWGKRVYGTVQSGLIAGGILLSSYQYFFQSRLAKTDMPLCLFILLSLYLFHLGYGASGKKRSLFYVFSFFFIGLATLTKGPFGFFIPLLLMAIFLVKERQWRIWVSRDFYLGYLVLGLTVLPWIYLFIHRVGLKESIALMRDAEILTRTAPVYFYFIRIWPEFAPWSILIPFLFYYLWKQKRKGRPLGESFFLIWFIVMFILLTLFKIRTSRYLLPVLPPLALMMGGFWKKKFSFFLAPFIIFVLVWHSVEFYWMRKNLPHSPGMVLAGELKPVIKDSTLFGYRLDTSTVEEINFYTDRVIPLLKGTEPFPEQITRKAKGFVLMPEGNEGGIQPSGNDEIVFVREFQYKKGRLVLFSHKIEEKSIER